MERSSGAIRTAYDMQIDGKRGAGRPKQTWKKLTEKDCREWKLTTAMLHASENWPLTKTNLQRLQRNDRAMIRQICSIKPEDVARVRSSELLAKLQLEDLDLILRERRLRWFGHVERSSGAIRTAYDMQIDGKRGAGRPKQTWKKLTEKDCREWKLTTVDPQERST